MRWLIECVHMTSRRPCWRSKQRNGGHVGVAKYSFGDWTLFLCKFLLLFYYANMASGHMSEHTLFHETSNLINDVKEMYQNKKCACGACDKWSVREKKVVCLIKYADFLKFSFPSPSALLPKGRKSSFVLLLFRRYRWMCELRNKWLWF